MRYLALPYRYRGEIGALFVAATWINFLALGHLVWALFATISICWFIALLADLAAAGNNAEPERFVATPLQRKVTLVASISCVGFGLAGWLLEMAGPWFGPFLLIGFYATPFYLPPRRPKAS